MVTRKPSTPPGWLDALDAAVVAGPMPAIEPLLACAPAAAPAPARPASGSTIDAMQARLPHVPATPAATLARPVAGPLPGSQHARAPGVPGAPGISGSAAGRVVLLGGRLRDAPVTWLTISLPEHPLARGGPHGASASSLLHTFPSGEGQGGARRKFVRCGLNIAQAGCIKPVTARDTQTWNASPERIECPCSAAIATPRIMAEGVDIPGAHG